MLRFIGVMNAAIWFGSAVFILIAAQVFFSEDVRSTPLGRFWPGVMVSFVFQRFFLVQCVCGIIAIAHQLAEWVYLGRGMQRWLLALLGVLLLVGLIEGLAIQPRIRAMNLTRHSLNEKYAPHRFTPAEIARAQAGFTTWHRVSFIIGITATVALGVFFWKIVNPGDNARFVRSTKFRS